MIEIVEFPERIIMGMARPFIPALAAGANAPEVIAPLWAEMSKLFFSAPFPKDYYPVGVGAMWPSESSLPNEMNYFAGYEVAEVPMDLGGLDVLRIPAGKYAAVTHSESMQSIPQTVAAFYSDLLPNSGLQRRHGMDLEIYIETGAPDFSSKAVIAAPIL